MCESRSFIVNPKSLKCPRNNCLLSNYLELQQTRITINTNNSNNSSSKSIVNPQTSRIKNQVLITNVLSTSYPKQQASTDQKDNEIKSNDVISDVKRRETWIHCIDGSISVIEALEYAFFDKNNGLFNNKTFKNYLPFYMKELFEVQKWLQIAKKHKLNQLNH